MHRVPAASIKAPFLVLLNSPGNGHQAPCMVIVGKIYALDTGLMALQPIRQISPPRNHRTAFALDAEINAVVLALPSPGNHPGTIAETGRVAEPEQAFSMFYRPNR